MSNPFSWDYLTTPVSETAIWGPFSVAYLLVFATGLFLAIFFANDAPKRLKNQRLLLQTIQRATLIAIPVFSLGLLFFVFRILQISAWGLGMRVWLYIMAIIAGIMIIYFWYYIRTVYPKMAAADEAEKQKEAYIRRPAHGSGSPRPKPRKGGKKKKKGKKAEPSPAEE
ncbi:MAG: hypothetical protein EA415_01190 [Sphaerobacteraceae bacterium]|nr:MAG: hypothetical protein EA415_01190 [Sphaerobacteraceae bacterium]